MRVPPIADNDVVLWKVCHNSRSQDINFHAEIQTSFYTIQNVELSDALVEINDVLQCVYHGPLLIRQTNDVEKIRPLFSAN